MTLRDLAATGPRRACLGAGVAATLVAAVAGAFDPAHFFPAWLFAWLCVLGITLGASVNVMIHELTGGQWGFAIRRPLEAAMGTLPVVALLGVPLLFGLAHLYPWAAARDGDALLAAKAWYLDTPFFVARAVIYFAVWIALETAMRRQWHRQRTNATPAGNPSVRALSIAGLMLYAVTVTLAAVDWIMSLSRDWYSTGFGLLVMTSQALAAFAFAVAFTFTARAVMAPGTTLRHADAERTGDDGAPTARDAQDLGNLLLMYVMMWAYLAFTQFLIIWSEDLPPEIGWYVTRSTPGWKALAIVIFALQFVLPFVAMLFRGFKRDPVRLGVMCAIVLGAHLLQVAWQVLPPFAGEPVWLPPLALCAIGGLWSCVFAALHAAGPPVLRSSARMAADHG